MVRKPSALPLPDYEQQLNLFFGNYCHRDAAAGWVRDKYLRDAGPFTATFGNGAWQGVGHGTHAPVVIWYSPEMADWLRKNRPSDGSGPATPPAVPDGAIMVKEMYPTPSVCTRTNGRGFSAPPVRNAPAPWGLMKKL